MILNGFCEKINKNCQIDVDVANNNDLENIENRKIEIKRIRCQYASLVNCRGNNCSVLKENNIKQ